LKRIRKEREWQIRELMFTIKLLSKNPSAVAGFVIIATMVFIAVGAPYIAPYDPI